MTKSRYARRSLLLASAVARLVVTPRKWGPFLDAYSTTRFDHAFSVSYSQGAEDLVLRTLLQPRGPGTYVDIGAHHPSRFSVTRLLYEAGWWGVNVDANPKLVREFLLSRPRDVSLAAWVGHAGPDRVRKFFVFDEPALSTAEESNRARYLAEGNSIEAEIQAIVLSLEEIIDRYLDGVAPDLLNVDCEGSDEEVLKSGNWNKYRPPVVVVETSGGIKEALATAAVEFLMEQGYRTHYVLPMATVLTEARTWKP